MYARVQSWRSATFAVIALNLLCSSIGLVSANSVAVLVHQPGEPRAAASTDSLSSFDALLASQSSEAGQVPYPFQRLIELIAQHTEMQALDNNAIPIVLVPFSRSMTRRVSAPDHFEAPHILVSVTADAAVPGPAQKVYLKDRLFLSYQARAERIEVISYSEPAGRFEFQVVRDYAAGKTPRVAYANREICLTCHQNGGPIFSTSFWDETNTNRQVADALEARHKSLHGIPVTRQAVASTATHRSIARANLMAGYQTVWGKGCAAAGSKFETRRCRAGAFSAMVEYRLGMFARIESESELFFDAFIPSISRAWSTHWPGGLRMTNSDIPNRHALRSTDPGTVDSRHSPMTIRESPDVWQISHSGRFLAGLADTIPDSEVVMIDEHLFTLGERSGERWQLNGPCLMDHQGEMASGQLVNFDCHVSAGAFGRTIEFIGELVFSGTEVVAGSFDSIGVGDGQRFADLIHTGTRVEVDGGYATVSLELRRRQTQVRAWFPDGTGIYRLSLRWPVTSLSTLIAQRASFEARAVVELIEGLSYLTGAIRAMSTSRDFDEPVFRMTRLIASLNRELGMGATAWCCNAVAPQSEDLSPTRELSEIDHPAPVSRELIAAMSEYCAMCHGGKDSYPIPFLSVDTGDRLEQRLNACAERIYLRLAMWRLPSSHQPVAPMPPPTRIMRTAGSLDHWAENAAYLTLIEDAESRLLRKHGYLPDVTSLVAHTARDIAACANPQAP